MLCERTYDTRQVAVLAREKSSGGLELPVFRRARSTRASARRGSGSGFDDVGVRSVAMQVGRLEEEPAAESLIPRDGLDDALRASSALRRSTCANVIGAPSGAPVGGEPADRLHVVLRECADGQRRALGEFAEAAAQDAPSLGQHAHRHARRAVRS